MTNLPPNPPEPNQGPWPPQQPPYGQPGGAQFNPPPAYDYGAYDYGAYGYPPAAGNLPPGENPPPPGFGYPPPTGFGYPPPTGFGYPPPQGFGYPPPGYGYPPPPQSNGTAKWLLIGGLALAVVIAFVVGIAVLSSSDDSKPAQTANGSSQVSGDEGQIRQLLTNLAGTSTSDLSGAMQYFCAGDRKLLSSIGDLGRLDIPKSGSDTSTPVKIADIQVNGDKATAQVIAGPKSGMIYFRKESGEWKFCMTASPGFPSRP